MCWQQQGSATTLSKGRPIGTPKSRGASQITSRYTERHISLGWKPDPIGDREKAYLPGLLHGLLHSILHDLLHGLLRMAYYMAYCIAYCIAYCMMGN